MHYNMVRLAGIEPARLASGDFKSPVSTYFTIGAIHYMEAHYSSALPFDCSAMCLHIAVVIPTTYMLNIFLKNNADFSAYAHSITPCTFIVNNNLSSTNC